jgi:hypothetical protein
MDHLHERLERLERRTHTVERQLRWWRGLAGGLLVLAVLTWALPVVIAQEEASERGRRGLAQRVAALEKLLQHFSREKNEIFITGANLHIINGLGQTDCTDEQGNPIPDCPNGLGNLIVGYNELRLFEPDTRSGSHNVVVGMQHNFSSVGGLVVGVFNEISGEFASITGGGVNTASGTRSAVHGGLGNAASGFEAVVSGGQANTASELRSVVSGGVGNTASGIQSTVSGGLERTASGQFDWVAGSLFEDE